MAQQMNPAIMALTLVLEDASKHSGTPVDGLIVQKLEFRRRSDDPGPLPPVFFVSLSNGMEYIADTQGNITRTDRNPRDLIDRELRLRFTQTGGIGGWTTTYVANDGTLTDQEADHLRQFLSDAQFFDLPDEVPNGDPIPDQYTYTLWIAHGRRNREISTYDGTGPHFSPAVKNLITWLQERASRV